MALDRWLHGSRSALALFGPLIAASGFSRADACQYRQPVTDWKAVVPNSQTLSAAVTVNANSSADAMTVTQIVSGRAISGVINNSKSTISAFKGTKKKRPHRAA